MPNLLVRAANSAGRRKSRLRAREVIAIFSSRVSTGPDFGGSELIIFFSSDLISQAQRLVERNRGQPAVGAHRQFFDVNEAAVVGSGNV
jgi:hypothetical protein